MSEKTSGAERDRTADLLTASQLLESKREQAQAIVMQVPATSSNRTAATSQNGARANGSEKSQKLTRTPGRCSACEARMGWDVVAGLCGRCPPEALRAFMDRVNGRRETRRAEAVQQSLGL
ncbi:MAG: hypothetical protein CL386_02770 [Acidiferrobacter sp.]|nr:hypothetical protein [Acidiferrobacter sp.]